MSKVSFCLFIVLIATALGWNLLIGGSWQNDSPILNEFKDKKVGVITAGGDSPDQDARQMLQFFRNRDIDAKWIPIYFPCDRRVQNPELIKMVTDSDIIFMAGGFSDKLQYCLFGDATNGTNPFLNAMRTKPNAGSSAGAMVMPATNILYTRTSEDSYQAVSRERIANFGAHGFKFLKSSSIVDSHVGERGRQGRVFVLAFQSKARYGFGIDENSGFIEKDGDVHFVGQKGVAVFDKVTSLRDGTMHYLSEGDVLKSDGEIVLADWKTPCQNSTETPRVSTNIFAHFRQVSTQVAKYHENVRYKGIAGRSPVVEVQFMRKQGAKTVCGTKDGVEYVSFTNMGVSMGKATDQKVFGDKIMNMEPYYKDE